MRAKEKTPQQVACDLIRKAKRQGGCLVWQGALTSKGYASFRIKGIKETAVHRFIYTAFYGEIPKGHQVHHTCLNHACIWPEHLKAKDPFAHAAAHSLLSDHDVCVIRHTYYLGRHTMREIAEHFGVHKDSIRNIIRWKRRVAAQPTGEVIPL